MVVAVYQNLFDSHIHSENSPDGHHSVTFLAETAIAQEFHGLSITDHCECDRLVEDDYVLRLRHAALGIAKAREAFFHRLILTAGIELGQPGFSLSGAAGVLQSARFDFVLLSVHRLQGQPSFSSIGFACMTLDQIHSLMKRYFDELLALVGTVDFDVLAHLTFPVRYVKLQTGIDLDLARYRPQMDALLAALVDAGKGLELNTSGLHDRFERTMPPDWVIRRFRELGGEIVTIGSDAHSVDRVGNGIQDGMRILEEAGYRYFAFYRGRRPVMLRII